MDLSKFKPSDKLPQGSYFYIKVGDRFYGGQKPEISEVEVNTIAQLVPIEKGTTWAARHRYRMMMNFSGQMRGSRAKRDRLKKTTASYLGSKEKQPKKIIQEFTGKSSVILTDNEDQAKKFRRKEQAETACKALQRLYEGVGAKVGVHYRGETS